MRTGQAARLSTPVAASTETPMTIALQTLSRRTRWRPFSPRRWAALRLPDPPGAASALHVAVPYPAGGDIAARLLAPSAKIGVGLTARQGIDAATLPDLAKARRSRVRMRTGAPAAMA